MNINKKMFRVIIPLVHDWVKHLPPTKLMIELNEFQKMFESCSEELQIRFLLWMTNKNLSIGSEPDEIKNLCSLIYKSTTFLNNCIKDIAHINSQFPMNLRFSFYLNEIQSELIQMTSTQFDDLIVKLIQISPSTIIEMVKSIYCSIIFPHQDRARIWLVTAVQPAEKNLLIIELQQSTPHIYRVLIHHQHMVKMILLQIQQLKQQLIHRINESIELEIVIRHQLKYLPIR